MVISVMQFVLYTVHTHTTTKAIYRVFHKSLFPRPVVINLTPTAPHTPTETSSQTAPTDNSPPPYPPLHPIPHPPSPTAESSPPATPSAAAPTVYTSTPHHAAPTGSHSSEAVPENGQGWKTAVPTGTDNATTSTNTRDNSIAMSRTSLLQNDGTFRAHPAYSESVPLHGNTWFSIRVFRRAPCRPLPRTQVEGSVGVSYRVQTCVVGRWGGGTVCQVFGNRFGNRFGKVSGTRSVGERIRLSGTVVVAAPICVSARCGCGCDRRGSPLVGRVCE